LDDIVGFGNAGVFVSIAQGDGSFGPATLVLERFGYYQGWRLDPNVDDTSYGYLRDGLHPRFVVDVTADGRADIVGFGDDGVYVADSRGDGTFDAPRLALGDFGPNSPRSPSDWWQWHPRFLAEVTGDQQPDIVTFRDSRVWVAAGRPGGTFAPKLVALLGEDFGDEDLKLHQGNQFLEDVNADDHADLVYVDKRKVFVALSRQSATSPFASPYVAAEFGSETFKNIRVVDVTGDKRAEILGAYGELNGSHGLYLFKGLHVSSISPSNGRYSKPRHAGADFFYPETGHSEVPTDYTWAVGDVSGDGYTDVIGSPDCDASEAGCASTYVAYSRGDGTFTDPEAVLDDFGPGTGWIGGRHVRLTGHITRDGNADIIGFGNPGVFVGVFRPAMDLVQNTRLGAARNADGYIDMYGLNSGGQVFASRHTGPDGTWSEWSQHDGVMTSLAVEANADGRLQMFGVDSAGQIWSKRQTVAGESWTTWGLLDGWLVQITAARNADGRLALFGVNGHGQVWYRQQASPGGVMSGWIPLDGTMRTVAADTNADGRIELFAIGYIRSVAAEVNTDGRVDLYALNIAGKRFTGFQWTPGSDWTGWYEITNGTMTPVPRTIPDLRGLSVPQATERLRAAGYFVVGQVTNVVDPTCNNIGLVMSHIPARDTLAAVGSPVRLTLGQRPTYPQQCK
jgi:hypothetical protein